MNNQWKKLSDVPKDNKNYLVSWKDCKGKYHRPHAAYYFESENKFFSLENDNSHPLYVDVYMEIPELPNE